MTAPAPRVLKALVDSSGIVCPSCKSGLTAGDSVLSCSACRSTYPIRHGVVDFVQYAKPSLLTRLRKPAPVDAEAMDAIVRALDLPKTDEMRASVVEICQGVSRTTANGALTAEISDLLDRFGLAAEVSHPPLDPRAAARVNSDVRVDYIRHYIQSPLPPDTVVYRNVRVANAGKSVWSSRVEFPLNMSYRWLDASGERLGVEGERTAWPIDVLPGRTLSLPLRILTPPEPGRYRLAVQPVREGRRWLEDQALEIDVVIDAAAPDAADFGVIVARDEPMSYEQDHEAATDFLRSSITDSHRADAPLRLLEIGGGAHPQLAWLEECEVVNVDISSPLLELGALYFGDRYQRQLCFVCCDALDSPFPDGTFDGVAMFATLHHFSEPERLLQECRRVAKPDGFVAVLSEPAGTSLAGYDTVRDLLKGINEQTFSVEEHLQIAAAAGLTLERARVDGDSFKAVFRTRPAG